MIKYIIIKIKKLSEFIDNKEIIEAFEKCPEGKTPSKHRFDLWRMSHYHYNDCPVARAGQLCLCGEERCWLDELKKSLTKMNVRDALIRMARWMPEN